MLLREVQRLSQDDGINLAGVKRIIELEHQVGALQARIRELLVELEHATARAVAAESAAHPAYRRNLTPDVSTALVSWRPPRR